MLADLTFKSLPVEGPDIHILGGEGFLLLLSKHPVLQALEMDESYRAFALACHDERVLRGFFRTPADSALDVFLRLVDVLGTLHTVSFSQLLLIELLLSHLLLVLSLIHI